MNLLAIAEEKAAKISTGLEESAKVAYGKVPSGDVSILVGRIIETVLAVVVLLFFILVIYGGVSWMLAGRGGKEEDIQKAKRVLETAVVGLVIVGAGYAITAFIVKNLITAAQ